MPRLERIQVDRNGPPTSDEFNRLQTNVERALQALAGQMGLRPSGGGAPGASSAARYWLSTPDATLPNGVNLGALSTGILKITVSGGAATPSIASPGADYVASVAVTPPITNTGTAANPVISLAANGVTDTFIRQGVATSVIGRSANSTGNVADIAASADGNVLWRNGTTLGFSALPYSKLTGAPADLSGMHFVTTQAEASLSAEFSLGALASGVIQQSVSAGVSTPSVFATTANRVQLGAASGGGLTDSADLTFTSGVLQLGTGSNSTQVRTIATSGAAAIGNYWKDISATKAVSFGNGISGSAPTDDAIIATFNGTSWSERVRVGNADGAVTIGIGTTGSKTTLSDPNDLASYAQMRFYPASGTNVGQLVDILPRGTGFSSTNKSQIRIFNHDAIANPTAYEFFAMRAVGTAGFIFGTGTVGLVNRDMMFAAGWMSDGVTNDGQLLLKANGDVTFGVGLATSATTRHLYIPSSAGTPTGVTTSYSSGAVMPIEIDRTNERFYVGTPGSSTWHIYGQYIGGLANNAILKNTTGGIIAAASSADVAGAITWPANQDILFSTGTNTAPSGASVFQYDSGAGLIRFSGAVVIGNFNLGTVFSGNYEAIVESWGANVWTLASVAGGTGTQRSISITAPEIGLTAHSIYHVGTVGSTNYERMRVFDNAGQITWAAEAGGTGSADNVTWRVIAKQLDIINNAGNAFFSVQTTGQLLCTSNKAVPSATGAVADTIKFAPTATVSGSTAITANIFAGVTISAFSIASAANVASAAGLDVSAPSISGGGVLTNKYAIVARGTVNVSPGGGASVFEVPADVTVAGAQTGRIPITVGGVTAFLHYFNG